MIEISRSLAKLFRAVARKSILAIDKQAPSPCLIVRGDRSGLRIQAQNTAGAIEFHQPGNQPNETYVLPFTALSDFEGKKESAIQFTKDDNEVVASWREGAVPQERRYLSPEVKLAMPTTPRSMSEQPAAFVQALQNASECTAEGNLRYATACIQLRGKPGVIIGTDGRQLLRQGGFTFSWKDDVLVPSMPIFASRELSDAQPFSIGKSDEFVCLSFGPWKLFTAINKEARFPKVDGIIPNMTSATVVRFNDEDAKFLTDNLASLPGGGELHAPVTIDANGQVLIRARGPEQPTPTELALVQSTTQGKHVCLAVNRVLLDRALRLGLTSMYVHATDQPVLFHEDQRDFVTIPLSKEAVVSESKNITRLLSNQNRISPAPPQTKATHTVDSNIRSTHVSDTDVETDVTPINPKHETNGIASLIEEAESLKELLRDGYSRAHTLLASAKRYRKQARVVNSTLASLRQLQAVED